MKPDESSSRSDAARRDGLLILVRNMREQIKRSPGMSHHPFSDEGWAYLETILSERGTLEAVASCMVKIDATVDICYPGDHGGPADKWLVTVIRQDANDISEHFGATLTEAMQAMLSKRKET